MPAKLDIDHDDQRQTLPAELNPVSFTPWCAKEEAVVDG
jgi:hypothetical protein|tara:strand:+ start:66 stop:182 length:117 start_codon:yes stop_codon:yes gene_type:complete